MTSLVKCDKNLEKNNTCSLQTFPEKSYILILCHSEKSKLPLQQNQMKTLAEDGRGGRREVTYQ